MNITQKTLLANEIKLQLSKAKITIDNLKQVKRDERDDYIETKLLEVNDACLRWALKNQIVSKVEIKTNKFYTNNSKFAEYILSGGLTSAGAIGATAAYGATVKTGLLSFFTTTVTTTTVMATAAPIALAGAGIYGVIKYKENKQIEKQIEYFENEKSKILSFYLNKIDEIKFDETNPIEDKNGAS